MTPATKTELLEYFDSIVLSIISNDISLCDISLDLKKYSDLDSQLEEMIRKLHNSMKKQRKESEKNKRYEITRHLIDTNSITILNRLLPNFHEENYIIQNCMLNYIGDIEWYMDSKISFKTCCCIEGYLLINSCSNPSIRMEIENCDIHSSFKTDISSKLNAEVDIEYLDSFSRTIFLTGCHQINNADMDGNYFRGLDVHVNIPLHIIGVKDSDWNPEWVICLAEGLAFLDKANYKMAELRLFAALDSIVELLYSAVGAAYLHNCINFLHREGNSINIEESDYLQKVIEKFKGENKRLLEEKLRPSLKQLGIPTTDIDDLLKVFTKAEKLRNKIAHGDACIVKRDDVLEFLYSFLSLLTQIKFRKSLSEYIKFIIY